MRTPRWLQSCPWWPSLMTLSRNSLLCQSGRNSCSSMTALKKFLKLRRTRMLSSSLKFLTFFQCPLLPRIITDMVKKVSSWQTILFSENLYRRMVQNSLGISQACGCWLEKWEVWSKMQTPDVQAVAQPDWHQWWGAQHQGCLELVEGREESQVPQHPLGHSWASHASLLIRANTEKYGAHTARDGTTTGNGSG